MSSASVVIEQCKSFENYSLGNPGTEKLKTSILCYKISLIVVSVGSDRRDKEMLLLLLRVFCGPSQVLLLLPSRTLDVITAPF